MYKSQVEKMKEGWRNLNSEEVHNLCLHQMSLIYYIEKLKMGETCGMKGEMWNAYKNWVVNSEQMKPHGAVEWDNIINMESKEGCNSVVGFSDKPERSIKCGKFLDQLND